MKNNLYVVRDDVAGMSGPVFEAVNDNVAIRKCDNEFRDNRYKQDFSLWLLGTIDHETDEVDFSEEGAKKIDISKIFADYKTMKGENHGK